MGGVDLGEPMEYEVGGDLVHRRATVLLRPGHAEQAELAHALDVVPGKRRRTIELPCHRSDVLPGKRGDQLTHLVMLRGEVQRVVHGRNISAPRRRPTGPDQVTRAPRLRASTRSRWSSRPTV